MNITKEARVIDDPLARESVFAHLMRTWGITITGYKPIFLGLRNMKWIVQTDAGALFLKCYHPKRYSLLDAKRREEIERSLSCQQYLHEQAVPCPRVWTGPGGEYVQCTPEGHFFVVMQQSEGFPAMAGRIDPLRMYRLGQVTGLMHRLLNRRAAMRTAEGSGWKPSASEMTDKWKDNCEAVQDLPKPSVQSITAMEKQGLILSRLDLSIFEPLEPGLSHWDYWVDNILFHEDEVSALVDFDTVRLSYPEIDVARILLSGALDAGSLRPDATAAFLDGYREQRCFPRGRLPLALKLLWCREAHWWLKGTMDEFSVPPRRFADELIWLTEHWDELDDRWTDF